ncbi:efflux RND transporter permease subunit [candidate division KSB1 bacterium]
MEKRSFLPNLSVNRPVTVIMILSAILVVGIIAYSKIKVELFPPGFTPPFLIVNVPYPNSNPSEIEEQITRPVEDILQTVKYVDDINSESSANGSFVFVIFKQNADMNLAYNQVRDRMERVMPELPSDVERFYVQKFDNNDEPILFFGISIEEDLGDPYYLIEKFVKNPLQRVDGIANVEIWGLTEKMILIDLDQEKINSLRLNIYPLIQSLQQDNFVMPSGYIPEGGKKIYVRSSGKFTTLEEIRNLNIRGTDILLKDIASVRYDVPETIWVQRINRKQSIRIGVFKESMANTVEISERTLNILNEEIKKNPQLAGMNFTLFFDQSEFINDAIDNLTEAGIWGGFFAFLILLFFLRRIRMTMLITLAIPLSIVITVIIMYFIGWSLNLFTLMGMMVCVGLVIDNSIVVVENIYRRRLIGDSSYDAAMTGASEVSNAITMATLTTIVVFLPLILMNDNTGLTFYLLRIGLPIMTALLGSLLVALVFIPLIANRLPIKGKITESRIVSSGRNIYTRMIKWSLNHRLDVTIIGLLILMTIQIPIELMEKTDASEGNINDFNLIVEMPDNYRLEDADELMTSLEDFLDERQDIYNLKTIDTRFRNNFGILRAYLNKEENNTWWYVFYRNLRKSFGIPVDNILDRAGVLEDLESSMPEFPGVEIRTRWWDNEQDDKAVSVFVYGRDTEKLMTLAAEVERRLKRLPRLFNIETDLQDTANEVHLIIDRSLSRKYGVSPFEIAMMVSYVIRGVNLPDFRSEEKEIDVRIQLEKADRESLHQLKGILVSTPAGKELPLSNFVKFEMNKGLGSINRINGQTFLSVKGYTAEADVETVYEEIDKVMAGFDLPRGYTWDKGNRFLLFQEQDDATLFAMYLAVTFVFILMGILFESFVLPLSIIFCIPFSFFGAYWTLFLSGTPFDIMAGIGLIILIGVVVNNAIVLVDLINRFRKEGLSRYDAIVEAGKSRFRPIFMTAFTTIFGLIPMGLGNSSLIGIPYSPMGRTIMGGLLTSTLFTLIFVPIAYTYFDDLREKFKSLSLNIIYKFK